MLKTQCPEERMKGKWKWIPERTENGTFFPYLTVDTQIFFQRLPMLSPVNSDIWLESSQQLTAIICRQRKVFWATSPRLDSVNTWFRISRKAGISSLTGMDVGWRWTRAVSNWSLWRKWTLRLSQSISENPNLWDGSEAGHSLKFTIHAWLILTMG